MGRIYFLTSLMLALVMWLVFTVELLVELTETGTQSVLSIYVPIFQGKKKKHASVAFGQVPSIRPIEKTQIRPAAWKRTTVSIALLLT